MHAITTAIKRSATMPPTIPPIDSVLSTDVCLSGMVTSSVVNPRTVVGVLDELSSAIVANVLGSTDSVSPVCPESVSVWIGVPKINDNVDIRDIDVVVDELVCCVACGVGVDVDGRLDVVVVIGDGGHVRDEQVQLGGAVGQSCWSDVNSSAQLLNLVAHQAVAVVRRSLQFTDST